MPLLIFLVPFLTQTMPTTKPQWEWLLIPRLQRKDGTLGSVRIFRWDHSYMDGASVGVLLGECIFDTWPSSKIPWVVNPHSEFPPRYQEEIVFCKSLGHLQSTTDGFLKSVHKTEHTSNIG